MYPMYAIHTLDVVIAREDENLLCSIRTDPSLMSDHVAVSCMIRGERPSTDERPQEYRKFSNIDHTLFADDLASFLDNQPLAEDVNSCVLNLDRDMERVLDIHAPVCLRTTQVRHRPKWYNEEVDAARRERRRQERKWRKSLKVNPDSDRSAYCEAKAAAAEALSRAKRFYYNDLFSESTPKDMYRELKHLLNKSKRFLPDADSSVELASTFCTFFSEKIRDLRRCIDDLNVDELDNPNGMAISAPSFVEFQLVTSEEVQRLIKRSPNKTCPLDPLPTWLLKRHLPVLLPKLTHIINASLASGDFPSSLGVASVTPVLKKPGLDKERMKNYRPISNIRFVAKLMERVVSSQLANYLEDNSLGDPKQSAYRKNHSTETALVSLQNDILCALDDRKCVILLSLDMSSAFDTLDHTILLTRLRDEYGVSGTALHWFRSYLSNRLSHVRIRGVKSLDTRLEFGVPQGSVMGPLLFTLYSKPVSDILYSHGIGYHVYADDIQVYIQCDPSSQDSVDHAACRLRDAMRDVYRWMTSNKLKLNQDKTELVVFASKVHQRLLQNFTLTLHDGTVIKPSKKLRILGVVFDNLMLPDVHVSNVVRTVKYHIRNLCRIRKYLDESTTHAAVRALVLSRLDYCNSLLSGTTAKNIHRLQLLQNQSARLIFKQPKSTHTTPLLNSLHWLPIQQRVLFKTSTLVFKSLHNLSPSYLTDLVHVRHSSYNLRSNTRTVLDIPRCRTNAGKRAFIATAPKSWNNLPNFVQTADSLMTFKKHLKTHLFN